MVGKPSGFRMAPRTQLQAREPLGRKPHRNKVHADLGIDQHVHTVEAIASRQIDRQKALHEAVAQAPGPSSVAASCFAGVW